MSFNFQSFFQHYNIPYITQGKNVKEGNINIKCPFCGTQDPSEHLGISKKTGYWGCWRNVLHRGRSSAKLVQAILGCSWLEANAIVESGTIVESKEIKEIMEQAVHLGEAKPTMKKVKVDLPKSFRRIQTQGVRKKFFDYLIKRKFREQDVLNLCKQYNLYCSLVGDWANRIIFPTYQDKKLIGWQGRAIIKAKLRYISHPDSTLKNTLFNYDNVAGGGRELVVTEGPLDCLKVDFYGQEFGARAIGLMGLSITYKQIALIMRLARRFKFIYILLDAGAISQAMNLRAQLASIRPIIGVVPEGANDPGAMTPEQIFVMCRENL